MTSDERDELNRKTTSSSLAVDHKCDLQRLRDASTRTNEVLHHRFLHVSDGAFHCAQVPCMKFTPDFADVEPLLVHSPSFIVLRPRTHSLSIIEHRIDPLCVFVPVVFVISLNFAGEASRCPHVIELSVVIA